MAVNYDPSIKGVAEFVIDAAEIVAHVEMGDPTSAGVKAAEVAEKVYNTVIDQDTGGIPVTVPINRDTR